MVRRNHGLGSLRTRYPTPLRQPVQCPRKTYTMPKSVLREHIHRQPHKCNGGNRPIQDIVWRRRTTLAPLVSPDTFTVLVNEARLNFTRFAFDQVQPSGQTTMAFPDRTFRLRREWVGDPGTLLGIAQSGTIGQFGREYFCLPRYCQVGAPQSRIQFGVDITREQTMTMSRLRAS